eukprot:1176167-Prorocentrum_minimum.AAC.1
MFNGRDRPRVRGSAVHLGQRLCANRLTYFDGVDQTRKTDYGSGFWGKRKGDDATLGNVHHMGQAFSKAVVLLYNGAGFNRGDHFH